MGANTADVLIIGGGYAGLALAYQLARRGNDVLLLEANGLGSGTSGCSAGRAQVAESHRGSHMNVVLAGLARLEALEEELDFGFEWRRLGNLMLIERDEHWHWWRDQVAYLQAHQAQAEMLDAAALAEAEPQLDTRRFRGAAWCLEGHLNPLKFCQAWAGSARRLGARLLAGSPVTGIEVVGGRVLAVQTPAERYSAGTVLATAGAWTGELLRLAGASLPVRFTHAEAFVSEPLPPLLHNHIGLADFYDTIHNQARAVSVGVAQQQSGALLVTEAVEKTPSIHRANSIWGIPGIARDLLDLLPGLAAVRAVRAWAAPSPFLPDEQPAIGWMPGFTNLFVATCFHLTITTIPVLSEWMAGMILGGPRPELLADFDPARFQTAALPGWAGRKGK